MRDFNPTIVRLKLNLRIFRSLAFLYFNPTIVRLKPTSVSGSILNQSSFQSYNSSIKTVVEFIDGEWKSEISILQ